MNEEARQPRCSVTKCGKPMDGVVTVRLNDSRSVELVACDVHGAEIDGGAPYRLDLESREPVIIMGAELAGLDQWQALRFGVATSHGSPDPLLHVTAQRLGTDETQEIQLALDPLVRDNLSHTLWMFEAVDKRRTTSWRPFSA